MSSEKPNLQEEHIARVVWAAHILAYLTEGRSHAQVEKVVDDVASDTDSEIETEVAVDDTDTATAKAVPLSASRESVLRKFLDCICQLLSPSKGWEGVTAASMRESSGGVSVDVARNDGFGSDCGSFDPATLEYCRMLEEYLTSCVSTEVTNIPAKSVTEFEAASIKYTASRVDYWISACRRTYADSHNDTDWNPRAWPGRESAAQTWTSMADLLLRFDSKRMAAHIRTLSVQRAYSCVSSPEVHHLLLDALGPKVGSRLWACAKSLSLHAEMQLICYQEECRGPRRMLQYYGCSKKACLLCETFLAAMHNPIETRGRHGVCYPAWGVPCLSSDAIYLAATELGNNLVNRIRDSFNRTIRPGATTALPKVMQSDFVSDFSKLTLEEWRQRQKIVDIARAEQTTNWTKLQLIEGKGQDLHTRTRPRPKFEPDNCCVMCNKAPARRCGRCRSTHYCSKDCQKSDFSSHKLLCKKLATLPDRPSPEHKRAIFFPVHQTEPVLIWIPTERQYEEDSRVWWTKAPIRSYLGPDSPSTGRLHVEHNDVRGRNLGSGMFGSALRNEGYCVTLLHRDGYLVDGSPPNKSILASVRASGAPRPPYAYNGPMVAMREVHPEDYADIQLSDFRHLMDYLITYASTDVRESVPDLQYRAPTVVRGVKICCDGEIKLHASEPFVSIDVRRSTRLHLSSIQGDSNSPISALLGIPLIFWKDPDAEYHVNPPGWDATQWASSNQNAAFMMMVTNPSDPSWGWAPLYWNRDIGNVWVVREDGQDLDVRDVAMMCHFARFKLQRLFEDSLESKGTSLQDRKRVLKYITRENMRAFWEETGGDEAVRSHDLSD
ncbi:hypothetical protein BO83DRAFT_413530 [Aspergillus eucalypticola CBS 122712]|uniref:MYND-type domain-containing protein n=1 Tax=Aspergillus eucalypticola (strain CBS 122712 / IBT 29274) TaxID=1448314 RepID=A0A317WG49_ASPEC|nr:uncharacterized protein BO83DRAFT_413530 [Aspergillus eucalypticola CBS 122712]PWY84008.1 hypothetical protein BO83DRAFT_413530 [Aspergillus eucalypticola CBS 122712]